MKWQNGLTTWRLDRNLVSPQDTFIFMVDEEIDELTLATSMDEVIDALCDIIVLTENQSKLENTTIDYSDRMPDIKDAIPAIHLEYALQTYSFGEDNTKAFQLLYAIAATFIEAYGYHLALAMEETVKEISSRKQDPKQAIDWQHNTPSGKWQKNKNQDPTTLYTADYSKCRV